MRPSIKRINYEFASIDVSHNNRISLHEWMKYVGLNNSVSGPCLFRLHLKKVFSSFDSEETGRIDISQVQAMVEVQSNNFISEFEIIEGTHRDKTIASLVSAVYRKLDHEYGPEIRKMNNKVTWQFFKDSVDLALIEMQELQNFL